MRDTDTCTLRPASSQGSGSEDAPAVTLRSRIRKLLPSRVGNAVSAWREKGQILCNQLAAREPLASLLRMRLQEPLTRVLGPTNHALLSCIELDVTYECNQHCLQCDRSCFRAPSTDSMALDQVQRFVEESVEQGICWERISVLGGEPTLHPDLMAILDILLEYQRVRSPRTQLVLKTHGNGSHTQNVLERIPPQFRVANSAKRSALQTYFMAFNVAPKDLPKFSKVDFTNACSIPEKYGCALTPYGYYVCPAMGGGIDRVMGFNLGCRKLPLTKEVMRRQMRILCPYCGHFLRREGEIRYTKLKLTDLSPSWRQAYQAYKEKPPVLQRY